MKCISCCWIGLIFLMMVTSCTTKESVSESSNYGDYPISPVDIRNVKMTDDFWLPIIKRVQEKTINFALEKCKEEGRFENFLIAGGQLDGEVRGAMPFDDTDVYKTIEGASNSLISSPNQELEVLLDSLIAIVAVGQEADGYLTTWRTINPAKPPAPWVEVIEGKKWEALAMSHELYNAGHLYEAAAVHYQATGKRNFLEIALANADLMVETFGKGKIEVVPGHQVIETGLIKLYRITGNEAYLGLAKYFLDTRGDYSSGRREFGPYAQDHLLVVEQDEVVGHAVRAVYMYAGMTDIAAIYQDSAYSLAVDALWQNMVSKKMYITGGIGAKHEGESFGDNYHLPNLTAYNETCASIGSVYWNHRLFQLHGEKKYYDIIERTLYNGLISGLSLDGQKFFYPNALESDGIYKFNQGACSRKDWFDCSCCPTNVIRFIPAMPGLIYAQESNNLYINLYAGSEANVALNDQDVVIKQTTDYPWSGKVQIDVTVQATTEMNLKLRIPGWMLGEVVPSNLYQYKLNHQSVFLVTLDGEPAKGKVQDGYYVLSRKWNGTSRIEIDIPMQVRQVTSHEQVQEDKGKTSLEYGPIVYAIEEVDNKDFYGEIKLMGDEKYEVSFKNELLEGVNIIKAQNDNSSFTAIPYYAWSNRGVGKMKVWIPDTEIKN